MNKTILLKFISPITPYLAVGFGLYILANGWITFLLYHAGLLCFIFLAGKRSIFRNIFSGWNMQAGVIAIFICSLAGPLLYFIWPLISIDPKGLSAQLGALGLEGRGWIIFVFIFIVINPLMEEVFWRGFLEGKGKLPQLADIIFAGYHLPVLAFFIKPGWLIPALAVISCGGWVWRRLSRISGGLAVSLASHIAADVSIVTAVQIIAN